MLIPALIGLGFVAAVFAVAVVFAPQGWRTAVFNAVTGAGTFAAPVTEHIAQANWEAVTDPQTAFFVVQGAMVGNIIWRVKTTTPIGEKTTTPIGESPDGKTP